MKQGVKKNIPDFYRVLYTLGFTTLVSILMISYEAIRADSGYWIFLFYNMLLAYFPALFAAILSYRLVKKSWLTPLNIFITLLWVGFLPNSFYVITDLIHAQASVGVDLLYNYVMLCLVIFNCLVAGYISLYLVHREMIKRFYWRNVHIVIGLIILACSFAIYLGRYLRWNSWDVIINPAGLLFDVTDSLTSPGTHPGFLSTTISFFLLLTTMYIVVWQLVKVLRKSN